jgi:glucose/mannose transport system permease protein
VSHFNTHSLSPGGTEVKWRKSKSRFLGFLVLLPSFLLLGIFVYYFIGRTVYWSMTDWGKDPAQALAAHPVLKFIGLANYRELFTGLIDARFRQDLVSTIFFTVFFIVGCLVLGLLLAILLDHRPKGESAFRTIFLFPFSLSFVVTGTIWRWLLQPNGGINRLPTFVGLPAGKFAWLTSRQQVWRIDWNRLPFIIAIAIGIVLLIVAIHAFRTGRRRRAWGAAACAVLLVGWALTIGRT